MLGGDARGWRDRPEVAEQRPVGSPKHSDESVQLSTTGPDVVSAQNRMLASEATAHVLDALCRLDLCSVQSQRNASGCLACAATEPALSFPLIMDDQGKDQARSITADDQSFLPDRT